MKVGILTFHHTANYGATLQAYALWKTIKSQGHNVEFIDYRPYKSVKFYVKEISPIRDRRLNPLFLGNALKAWKMRKFLLSQVQLSPNKSYTRAGLKNYPQQYDVVVCGSDQIWNFNSHRGFDPSYFLDFINETTHKVSYAASFGNTNALETKKEEICNLINQFDFVLVRDLNSLQLIGRECGREATRVLDPTFLVSYDDIISFPKLQENYLLVFADSLTPEQEDFAKAIAKIKDLTIISIGSHNRVAQKNLIGIAPEEWLGYFASASYVITSRYHGTIFSIIFKKPFTVLGQEHKLNKVNDLLGNLGLESRMFSSSAEIASVGKDIFDISYDSVYEILQREIQKSQTYLCKAIEGK